jgi:hypothetical protein
MKILFLFLVTFLCVPIGAQAEPRVGGKAGLNFASLLREAGAPSPVEPTYKHGLTAGAYLQLRYFGPLVPQIELLLTSRGGDFRLDGESLGLYKLGYIDVPLLARFELPINSATLYGLAGPELNVLLTATLRDGFGALYDKREDFKFFDLGVLIGAGVATRPFSWGTLTIETRYERGFTNIIKDDEAAGVSFTNQTITFLVGYEYRRDRNGDGIPR